MKFALVLFSMGELPHLFMIPEKSNHYDAAIKSNGLTINVNNDEYPPESCQLLCELSDVAYCIDNKVDPGNFDFDRKLLEYHLTGGSKVFFQPESEYTVICCEFAL